MTSADTGSDGTLRIFSQAECETLAQRVFMLLSAPDAELTIQRWTQTATDFVRGDVHMARVRSDYSLTLDVHMAGQRGSAQTNQWDDAGLRRLVAEAEGAARAVRGPTTPWDVLGPQQYPAPPQRTFASVLTLSAEACAAVGQRALEAMDAAGLVGAGELAVGAGVRALLNTAGLVAYSSNTSARFDLTARTPDGTGSGWAWSGHEDWARVDPDAVIARAVELAQRSARPVAVEPGRYTVILEPAAVAALLDLRFEAYWAEQGRSVFSGEQPGTTKLGRKMIDERLGMVADPWDPLMPRSSVDFDGSPLRKVVWFDHGVLTNLSYDREYAKEKGREPVLDPGGLRLTFDGPTETLEEMIASTRRGLWVNRLDGVTSMNGRTELATGTTRDGTFLIEDGKVVKAVKNFRFAESPFFVLNKLEAVGEPVRASGSVVAPRLKVRDFHMTSLSDAV